MTNYIVENKDMLPVKDMSDEDKLKIVNAVCNHIEMERDGGCNYGHYN